MAEVKKRTYRLFKIAKEFNVSINTIVEHLHGKGHEVNSGPNTKLPEELYSVLLKEFASEKQLKEKAEQIVEKRKEIGRSKTLGISEEEEGEEKESDNASPHVSAEQLRHSIRSNPRRRLKPAEKSPGETIKLNKEVSSVPPPLKPPAIKEEEEVISPPEEKVTPPPKEKVIPKEEVQIKEIIEPPLVEKVSPPKQETKIVEAEAVPKVQDTPKEEVDDKPKLKVLGKIDLTEIDHNRKKEKPPLSKTEEKPKEEVVKETPQKKAKPAKKTEIVKETTPPKRELRKRLQKKEVKTPLAKNPPKKTPKKEPLIEQIDLVVPLTTEEEQEAIMRAGDRTPNLRGLKVMGKIELPTDKPKKKKDKNDRKKVKTADEKAKGAAEKPANATTTEDGDDANKKRRRRRRKRKRKSAVKTDVKNPNKEGAKTASDGNVRKKRIKVTGEEVDASIKQTYAQMNRTPSRDRQRLRRKKRDQDARKREEQKMLEAAEAKILQVTEFITANEFANLIEVPVTGIITKSFELGIMISINQRLDAELLSVLAEEYGYRTEFIDVTEEEFEEIEEEDKPEDLEERSPIITVMGHVDHGKTTLLDYLRKTNVTSQEAGGITQHIGAYEVTLASGRHVTFLDTPGHEAFTAMRARGAKVTDVVIVVVAADDAVMPQTREAINHAQAASVPMIFAINKMDKDGADSERIKGQLAEMNLLVEDWGGTYQSQEISALKGENVNVLLEKVILEADLLELKANPNRASSGTVIEARLDKGRGNVATMLVQKGTLCVGDEMVAGIHYGKVRALIDQNGQRIKEAGPAKPVQVLGLSGQPQAGDKFQVFTEDGKAKSISQKRSELFREQQFRQTKHITLEEITRRRAIGNFKELNIIIRGDVDGSVEALSGSLLKLSTDEVQVNILLKGVGAITESDVTLASASDAIVLAFNVRPNALARQMVDREGVELRTYSVIYDAINDVKDALEGLLSPEIKEEILGTAEVKEVFKITKVGTVAGCQVTHGKLYRNELVRIIREGVVIYDSKFSSLKRFKDDVKEVVNGLEFGAMIENYNDIKVGDVFEAYRRSEVRRKL